MSSSAAKALHERQRHYDELHHMMRMEWLDSGEASMHDIHYLRPGSIECLRLIRDHSMSTNSVDLNDLEYVRELDEFYNPKRCGVAA